MSEPLLATKFHIPSQSGNIIPRPRLTQRLCSGDPARLTLITAPAGFGKTTLAADWIAHNLPEEYQDRVSWLSLDSSDNNHVQFWMYVVAALQKINPSIGKTFQTAFQAAGPLPPVEKALTSLINEIAKTEKLFLLGLDDYHEITNPEIHQGVVFLIENLPRNMHLVILSREDVPFPVSRYRVNGQLNEIRAADLRFSQTESSEFFNELHSLSLPRDEIESLTTRTEGWIAGLQLAGLSLKSADDKSGFIQAFAGSHRFVTDYLVDEVLSRQTAAVQQFLRRTSILERFCSGICDELIEYGESRQILRQLEQNHLFIMPLDNERTWYRYHQLFAEFLRMRLHEHEPEIIPALYRQTIDWFIEAGLHREALKYALQAKEFEKAADLIELLAPEALEQYNHPSVIQWCKSLPQELIHHRPFLCVYLGWAFVLAGQMETASFCFKKAEACYSQLSPEEVKTLQGYIFAHRTYLLLMQGDFNLGIETAQQALELLPPDKIALRAWTTVYMGNACNYCGRLQDAKDAYHEALVIAKQIGSLSLAEFCYSGIGETLREEGRLTEALDAYTQFLAFVKEKTGQAEPPLVGQATLAMGVISRERYDLDKALTQIQKGVALCREWQQGVALAIGLMELAEVHRLRGDYAGAASALQEVREIAAEISPWAMALVEGVAARLSISRGDINSAIHWAENAGLLNESCELGYERFPECPALSRMFIHSGNPRAALDLTEKLLERDRLVGRMGRVLDLLILQFAALDELGEMERALQVLSEAVELAGSEKHIRPFVDECSRLPSYLQKMSPSPLRNQLLKICNSEQHEAVPETGLVEPLNEREISILRMMSVGRTNREIGDELYLSVNTIRWYASQTYTKLGVKNRGEAVAKARDLGIL